MLERPNIYKYIIWLSFKKRYRRFQWLRSNRTTWSFQCFEMQLPEIVFCFDQTGRQGCLLYSFCSYVLYGVVLLCCRLSMAVSAGFDWIKMMFCIGEKKLVMKCHEHIDTYTVIRKYCTSWVLQLGCFLCVRIYDHLWFYDHSPPKGKGSCKFILHILQMKEIASRIAAWFVIFKMCGEWIASFALQLNATALWRTKKQHPTK